MTNLKEEFEAAFPISYSTVGDGRLSPGRSAKLFSWFLTKLEEAKREQAEEIIERLTTSGEAQNRAGFKEGLVILEEADYLRKVYLPQKT